MKNKRNYIILLIAIVILFAVIFVKNAYGKTSIDQMIYHLFAPVEGTTAEIIPEIIFECFLKPLAVFGILLLIVFIINKVIKQEKFLNIKNKKIKILPIDLKNRVWGHIGGLMIACELIFVLNYYDVFIFIKNIFTYSNFIEENYVNPNSVKLEFPETKKNLIYIYVESLESTYTSKNLGGGFNDNLIPKLTFLAKSNTNFSNNGDFGGLYGLTDTDWTIAGIVSQTAGIPLKVSTGGHPYKDENSFLKDAVTLGDILENQGYNQMFLVGSDATFAGRRAYLNDHGNYDIVDYHKVKEKGYIENDYYNFWGYEDSKLFEFAKKEIENLAEPFNLTMLTVNTHTPGGYLEDNCEKKFKNQIENVISCTDKQLFDFVNWLKEQPFYDNTTIIIVGDHLNMNSSFIKTKERYIYNVIINGLDTYNKKRMASGFDMFPTTLAALNVKIEGNRLGLGTNLYSEEETIIEKYGNKYINDELKKKSTFYNEKFLY